jgi:mannose-6-phosphate isomerase-like protein (cupin superfamily)
MSIMNTTSKFKIVSLRVLSIILLGILLGTSSYGHGQTSPVALNLDDVNWGPTAGRNGSPLGLRTARQGIDPVTGGITYYAMFPAGSHFDLHWHTHDEYVVVVKGSVVIELGEKTHTLTVGSYVVIPGEMNHSWDVPLDDEVVILVRRAGPADFHYVDK